MAKPQLFHKQKCPYSKKVRDFIADRELESRIQYRDIEAEPEAKQELQELTGHTQVPCLTVNNQPLLESDAIVEWLQSNFSDEALGPAPGQL